MSHNLATCPLLTPVTITQLSLDKDNVFRLQRLGFKPSTSVQVILRHKHHVVVVIKGVRYGLDSKSARCIEVVHD